MNYLLLVLLISALSLIQFLIGGTRLLYSFPSYWILGVCGVLSLFSAFRKPKTNPDPWCLLSCAAFFSYILARAKMSPIDYLARPDFFMVLGCLLAYFLTAFYLTSTRHRLMVVVSFMVLAAVHVGVGSYPFSKDSTYMILGFSRADISGRASGLFVSGNHMAGFLEAVAVLGLSLAWWSRWPVWAKVLVGYVSLGCYAGVAITGSRGGMLSSVFSVLTLAVLGMAVVRQLDRERFVRTMFVCVAVVGIGLGGASYLALHSQLIKARLSQEHTKDVRIYNWQATLDQFHVAPLFGTGAGTHLYYGRHFRRPQIQADPVHSHGDYLELLAEYGVLGAIGMAVFLGIHLVAGFRSFGLLVKRVRNSYETRSDSLALQIGVICAVFGLMAHSVVDFNMHIPANALMFAFFFGILANPGPAVQRKERTLELWASGLRFALPLLGIGVCALSIPKYAGEYFAEKSRVAVRDGRYPEAIMLANRGLGEQPKEGIWIDRLNQIFGAEKANPFLYFYIGEANRVIASQMTSKIMARKFCAPAVAAYKKGLAIFPEDENSLVRMAQCQDVLMQFPQAEEAFQKAIQYDPNLGVIYEYYAEHLKMQGKQADIEAIAAKARNLARERIVELGTSELKSK